MPAGPTVLFGGSFDPVHRGHLEAAKEAAEQLEASDIRFMPCHIPPHKEALKTQPHQRVAMLELALADYPGFCIDTWELEQHKPSYTLDTLKRYRSLIGADASLVFLMGWDSLQSLQNWYHWQELPALTNFAVWQRPGYSQLPEGVNQWLQPRLCGADEIVKNACGRVALLNTTPHHVSATQLRTGAGELRKTMLPPTVASYIDENGLYRNL